ncbi:hypothetical protein ACH5RR_036749 [Cinchona calisaya]|uniref:Helicase MOV-10-like beta-barrel domain-containing protein n=1 Tax=Cinchona calisaya TaxID=153742 RepID=A0ABD2Y914_9GENT
MQFFIRILKHIFGVEDEKKEISQHQSQSYYDFQRAPNNNSFSGSYTSSGNKVVKPVTSSAATGINNKNPSIASQSTLPYSVHYPKLPSVTTRHGEILKKQDEIPQKPNSLTSSNHNIPQSNIRGANANTPTQHKLSSEVTSASDKQLPSFAKLPPSLHFSEMTPCESITEKPHSFPKPDSSVPYSLLADLRSPKPPPLSTKPVLSLASPSSLSPQTKAKYTWVEKNASSTYIFPKDIRTLIENDIVPGVLNMPLSMSTYMDYFHALLYAEDCYLEKWDGFEMKNVNLKLQEAAIYTRKGKHKNLNAGQKEEKTFVTFEMEKVPERRPFLLSRDFVSLQPSDRNIKPFQGVIYRVVKSNLVLAEFGDGFYSRHHPECKYNVKFSFNRVCLKRAHHAIAAASDPSFKNFLFPDLSPHREPLPSTELVNYMQQKVTFAVHQILRLQGFPPYLLEGPTCIAERDHLSKTGEAVVEAILRILRRDPSKRILLCAPINKTCDLLMRTLKKDISGTDLFRANAAFRELDGIPVDILPSCLYERENECFSCPSLKELGKFKVILSTFMSSFRLYSEGIKAGHFSHIFLIDASSATEPETMVPLTSFANDKTIVVVTGTPRNHSSWIRSKIARGNGLMISYFERLRKMRLYEKLDPRVITQLEDT